MRHRGAQLQREGAGEEFIKMFVKILKDIQLRPDGFIFHRRGSRIELDTKNVMGKKQHALIYQQGEHYGTVGDCCEYITHARLLDLQRDGYVMIGERVGA
jgi:hypothetical protein